MNIPFGGENQRKKTCGKKFSHLMLSLAAWHRGQGADLPCRQSRFDSPLSCLFLCCTVFFSFCFCFLNHIFPVWLVSLYSYCWPIIASRGFCDKRISIAYVAVGPRIVYFNDITYFKNDRFRVIGTQARNVYSYLEKGCRKKCARHNPERQYGTRSMQCSLTLQLSNLLSLLSFSTRKHTSMAFHAILSNFFDEE